MALFKTVLISFLNLYSLILLARVLAAWVDPGMGHPVSQVLVRLTEPILTPVRQFMPRNMPFDFSPLVVFLLVTLLTRFIAVL